jgi:hypothetical protein
VRHNGSPPLLASVLSPNLLMLFSPGTGQIAGAG